MSLILYSVLTLLTCISSRIYNLFLELFSLLLDIAAVALLVRYKVHKVQRRSIPSAAAIRQPTFHHSSLLGPHTSHPK